jgi:general secretion pathway protein B
MNPCWATPMLPAKAGNSMSYILDALRRADAERSQGQVPGLHAPGLDVATAQRGAPWSRAGLTWVLALLAAALLAALVVTLLWSARARVAAAPATAAAPPAPAPTASAVAVGQVAHVPIVPLPAPMPPALPVVVTAPPAPRALAPAVAPPPALEQRRAAVPLAALSPEQQRELPPLAIGGWVWSESAAQRFVVINGALLHEGEAAAAGLTLERIGPRSLTLRWRDGRIEVPL